MVVYKRKLGLQVVLLCGNTDGLSTVTLFDIFISKFY